LFQKLAIFEQDQLKQQFLYLWIDTALLQADFMITAKQGEAKLGNPESAVRENRESRKGLEHLPAIAGIQQNCDAPNERSDITFLMAGFSA
jgi:hypothetical protein